MWCWASDLSLRIDQLEKVTQILLKSLHPADELGLACSQPEGLRLEGGQPTQSTLMQIVHNVAEGWPRIQQVQAIALGSTEVCF